MKNIFINNPKIVRNPDISQRLTSALQDRFQDSVLWTTGAEVFSDAKIENTTFAQQNKKIDALISYTVFIGEYLDQILSDNDVAEARKPSPYDIFVSLTIDLQYSKAKLHFYLDGDIFGLVAGTGYANLVNFIRISFPIYSKIGLDVEMKLFSLSVKDTAQKEA